MPARRSRPSVLIVDDDADTAAAIARILEESGYQVWRAATGAEATSLVTRLRPDLIILDLILPDVDGLVLCSTLNAMTDAPILICSGTLRRRDPILGLRLGADDFIGKPFDLEELEARVGALLRRSPRALRPEAPAPAEQVRIGALEIDRTRRRVTLGGAALQLTPTEYRLLSALASRADAILSRPELAQQVWGYQDASQGRTIDVHMRRLRVKLAGGPVPAPAIVAVRGFGYKLAPDEEPLPPAPAARAEPQAATRPLT